VSDHDEPTIKHKPSCSELLAPRYEVFAGVLVSRCPECDQGVPHPRSLSRADLVERQP
jgi:hypothetical protein